MFSLLVAQALAQSAPPVERRLFVDRVDASSFLWNDWNKFQENYHPNYVIDGDPATAWVEGAANDGAGEWLRLPVTPMDGATRVRLRVRNGYQKSSTLFKANARVREVEVRLLPGGTTTTATLTDTEGWQELTLTQPAGRLEGIELEVRSTWPGTKYTDLCVSDVEIYVTAATRDNPAAEKAKLDRITAWKANRVAAARSFASNTSQHMPVGSAYRLEVVPGRPTIPEQLPCGGDLLCESRVAVEALQAWPRTDGLPADLDISLALAREALASHFAGWAPVQVVATDRRPVPPVEGLSPARLFNCYYEPALYTDGGQASGAVELPVPGALGFLRADGVGTFAVTGAPTVDEAVSAKAAACRTAEDRPGVVAWAKTIPGTGGAPASVRALYVVSCGEFEDREGVARVSHGQLLVYGADGNLQVMVGPRYASAFAWRESPTGPVLHEAWRVGRWTEPVRAREVQAVSKAP